MSQYLLSNITPAGATLEPSELQSVIGRVIALTEEMQAAGVWVFAMPLADPSSATDRLTPSERVAFVLHDSFGFEFPMIADLLEVSPAAARKLASRAPAKVAAPMAQDQLADWEVVDAFLAAARGGDLQRLLQLLAPDVLVIGDSAAAALGTPSRIEGRAEVAAFFNGAAASALPVYVDDRPGAAWFDRGTARVAFDFTVVDGRVTQIVFRADPAVIDAVRRRRAGLPR